MSKIKAVMLALLISTLIFSGGIIDAKKVNSLEILSQPLTITEEGYSYNYQVRVELQEKKSLEYSLISAPRGMVIDDRGQVSWVPDGKQAGEYLIEIMVSSENGEEVIQNYTLLVAEAINNVPEIISEPDTLAQEGEIYNYAVKAEDADGDDIIYHLTEKPMGMIIDQVTGEIIWIPGMEQTGEHTVCVTAADKDSSSEQSYILLVEPVNKAPKIVSVPKKEGQAGKKYIYKVIAIDYDGDELLFNLEESPEEMIIDSKTGMIEWTPDELMIGEHEVVVNVSDGELSDIQEFILEIVEAVNADPVIISIPPTEGKEGEEYYYNVEAVDPDSIDLIHSLRTAPESMNINEESGEIIWLPDSTQSGKHEVEIVVEDGDGGEGSQYYVIDVEEVLNTSPEITSDPMTKGIEEVEYSYQMEARDADGDPLEYSLVEAPEDMKISETGLLTWIPERGDADAYEILIIVSDGRGGLAKQAFILEVESINNPPVIENIEKLEGEEEYLHYRVDAFDPDGDKLHYKLINAPEGMEIDADIGEIIWNISEVESGEYEIEINVSDPYGGEDTAVLIMTVETNEPPVIESDPRLTAYVGEEYNYKVEAEDKDGDPLNYFLVEAPEGMVIDAQTGLITWIPEEDFIGDHRVTIEVSDGRGGIVVQSYLLRVEDDNEEDEVDLLKPEVNLILSRDVVEVGQSVDIFVEIENEDEIEEIILIVGEEEVELDNQRKITYQSEEPGLYKILVTARNTAGYVGYDREELRFLDDSNSFPTAEIISPEEGTVLNTPAEIVGTASDEVNMTYYRLEYSPQGKEDYVTFAEGREKIEENVLGTLDTTRMRNGYYNIRLRVENSGGKYITDNRIYMVEGQKKIGNFTITFEDLNIPISGIPITVHRTYDSRDRSKGAFGCGWNLDLTTVTLGESCIPGKYWEMNVIEGPLGLPTYQLAPYRDHYVTVDYPDGSQDKFRMELNPNTQDLTPPGYTNVRFEAVENTSAELEALTDNYVIVNNTNQGVELISMQNADIYDPDRYKLTRSDGTELIINQKSGLESITDKNGNSIFFSDSGISHSSGKEVYFIRDSENRITSITDPEGNSIHYNYDSYGDLISVTDREGNTTRFSYNMNHGLVDIIDPRGVRAARNEYDEQGRLIAHEDAEGKRIEYTHNIGERQELVKDRLGNITVYDYDNDGNILAETDALGNTKLYTYDDNGNKTSKTDALGNTTTYSYDENSNILTETDSLGNTYEYSYNDQGEVLTITDPQGNTFSNEYDENGNLIKGNDPAGNVTTYTYDEYGNMTGRTDPENNVTRYEYDSYGNLISETDPTGNTTTYTYDINGNNTGKTVTRTTSSGLQILTTYYQYDSENRLIKTTYPDGTISSSEYNAIGKKASQTDRSGYKIEYEYDNAGNLIRKRYPDGTEEDYTYDAEGNKLTTTDRAGRITSYEYDALGQTIKIIHPDGSSVETVYDAAGRVKKQTDELGNETTYTYDEAGNCTSVTDAVGNTVQYEYNERGQRIKMIDARDNITEDEYNELGLKTKTIFPDGTTHTINYDANGNKISETDQAGLITRYEYDQQNRLIKVIDAVGNETTYTYDETGNMLTQTDANSNTSIFEYNIRGQRVKRTLPLGMSERYEYDEAGNLTSETDFNGNTIAYEYNNNDRLTKKTFPDGSTERYTYTLSGNKETVTTSAGTTYYEYDELDRLTRKTTTEGLVIEYTYDAAGNKTSMITPSGTTTYSYDKLNRLKTVTEPDGQQTIYAYDANGSRASVAYPNGTKAEYTYDSLNRLIELVNKNANGAIISSYKYTLGPAGNRLKVEENNGKVVEYTYDDLYRLTEERIYNSVEGSSTITYTYDPAGNRLSKTEDGVITEYTYDENNRLITEGEILYIYDDNGNTIGKTNGDDSTTYIYDYQDRLVEVNTIESSIKYQYNYSNIRTKKIVDGNAVTYLIDENRDYAQVVEERDSSGSLMVSYTYGDDLISQNRSGSKSYYHYDGLGSTRVLTDSVGNKTDTYTYDAFGEITNRTGNTENNYLYTGEQYDPNIGFYYLRARYMDPGIGRFINMDTWQGSVYDPGTLHKYLYANADPVNRIDPSGNFAISLFGLTVNISLNITLNTVRVGYSTAMCKNLIDVVAISETMLKQAMMKQNIALAVMSRGCLADIIFELYQIGRQEEAAAYKAMNKAMGANLKSFLYSLMNPVKFKIGYFVTDLRSMLSLCTNIMHDPTGAILTNLPSFGIPSLQGRWQFLKLLENSLKHSGEFINTVMEDPSKKGFIKGKGNVVLSGLEDVLNFYLN